MIGSFCLGMMWQGWSSAGSVLPVLAERTKLFTVHLLHIYFYFAGGVEGRGCGDMCGRAQTHSSRPAWVTEGPALSSSGSDIPPPGDHPAPLNDSRSVFNFTFRRCTLPTRTSSTWRNQRGRSSKVHGPPTPPPPPGMRATKPIPPVGLLQIPES